MLRCGVASCVSIYSFCYLRFFVHAQLPQLYKICILYNCAYRARQGLVDALSGRVSLEKTSTVRRIKALSIQGTALSRNSPGYLCLNDHDIKPPHRSLSILQNSFDMSHNAAAGVAVTEYSRAFSHGGILLRVRNQQAIGYLCNRILVTSHQL